MVTLHVIAPFHARIHTNNSADAFAANVLRFAKMMKPHGFRVVEYFVGTTSDSEADEHVSIMDDAEWEKHWGDTEGKGASPTTAHPMIPMLLDRLRKAVDRRLRAGDIVLHFYGDWAQWLIGSLSLRPPRVRHVEPAIGYDRGPFGAERIFPSEAWRHYSFGKYPHTLEMMRESAVIPHYFDPEEWPYVETPSAPPYILFAGRLNRSKYGLLSEIVRELPSVQFKIAGEGDSSPFEGLPNVELLGLIKGKARAELYGNATALLCPTEFIEPFGAVAIEAMLCGTPVIATDYGAYTETIPKHLRCSTLKEWTNTIDWILTTPDYGKGPRINAREAATRYALEEVSERFVRFFTKRRVYGVGAGAFAR